MNVHYILKQSEIKTPNTVESFFLSGGVSFYESLPAQVFLTNFGWNHPDLSFVRQIGRTKFQENLNRGIVNHPWYNPRGWEMYSESPSNSGYQRFYVFLDLETCYEENFPNYGWGMAANSDRENGRPALSSSGGQIRHLKAVCPVIDGVLDTPLFQDSNSKERNAVLVLFDCGWNGPPQWSCLNRRHNSKLDERHVSIVSESASYTNMRSALDLGLPPPAIHPVTLNPSQEAAIVVDCSIVPDSASTNTSLKLRPYLLTFTGNFRHDVRQQLLKLHNPEAGILIQPHFGGSMNSSSIGRGVHDQFTNLNGSYTKLLGQSQFAGVPRGDNLFSYRFAEALSAGCIPVVYADGWVLPFSKALVDWTEIAVIIPERDALKTLSYLNNLTVQRQCQMRQRGYLFYKRYMATPEGVIAGIVESLELLQKSLS